MSEPITVTIKVEQTGELVYEIRAIMKGRFYKRLYVGYSEQDAITLFQKWLGEQL